MYAGPAAPSSPYHDRIKVIPSTKVRKIMQRQAKEKLVRGLWQALDRQDWQALPAYFSPDGEIYWQGSNERFDVLGFQRANSEYPGGWRIEVLRLSGTEGESMVSVVRVKAKGGPRFHACSFFSFDAAAEKICRIDEYWGEMGPAPPWRQNLGLSRPID